MNVFMVIDCTIKQLHSLEIVCVATDKSLLEQQKSKMMQVFGKLPNSA